MKEPEIPFKVLMSHDPSHWNAEVTSSILILILRWFGHTHGIQFGVEIPGFRWSPVKYMYRQWAGLRRKQTKIICVWIHWLSGAGWVFYPKSP